MDIEKKLRFELLIDQLMYNALAKISDDERCRCEVDLDGKIERMCPRCLANTTLRSVDAVLVKVQNENR